MFLSDFKGYKLRDSWNHCLPANRVLAECDSRVAISRGGWRSTRNHILALGSSTGSHGCPENWARAPIVVGFATDASFQSTFRPKRKIIFWDLELYSSELCRQVHIFNPQSFFISGSFVSLIRQTFRLLLHGLETGMFTIIFTPIRSHLIEWHVSSNGYCEVEKCYTHILLARAG